MRVFLAPILIRGDCVNIGNFVLPVVLLLSLSPCATDDVLDRLTMLHS